MNRLLLMIAFSLSSLLSFAQLGSDWQKVKCISAGDKMATFTSVGQTEKKRDLAADAKRRLFYALFYKGVIGINNDLPLVETDNPLFSSPFFQEGNYRFEAFIINTDETEVAVKKGGKYMATYTIQVSMVLLLDNLEKNNMRKSERQFGSGKGPLMPSIMVMPYRKSGENYEAIIQNNFDLRIAMSNIQDALRSRNITTINYETFVESVKTIGEYESNSNSATSNDKQMLMASKADVHLEVDLNKEKTAKSQRVQLIMRAYETATGAVLASKEVLSQEYNLDVSVNRIINYIIQKEMNAYVNDICNHWNGSGKGTNGSSSTRIVLQFAIDGNSMITFNEQVGPNNYSLSNVIRQWVRKNCYQGQYHLRGIMDDSIIFDNVTIPPVDQDGLPMDAAQFAFLLESYLKEDNNVNCSSRIQGNIIMFTIY